MSTCPLENWATAAMRYPLLSDLEVCHQAQIIQRWKAGTATEKAGIRAVNRLVDGNLRLVILAWNREFKFVKALDPRLQDLLQEGALGIRRAALKYDATKGYKFSTYAMNWVRRYMLNSFRLESRSIRMPGDVWTKANRAKKISEKYEMEHGHAPTLEYLGEQCKKKPHLIAHYLERLELTTTSSLDLKYTKQKTGTGRGHGEQLSLMDVIENPENYNHELDRKTETLNALIDSLIKKAELLEEEAVVLRERWLWGAALSYAQIGKDLGRAKSDTKMNVIEGRAIRKLTRYIDSHNLSLATEIEKLELAPSQST